MECNKHSTKRNEKSFKGSLTGSCLSASGKQLYMGERRGGVVVVENF
jgi:hypothetical protein